MEDQKNGQDQRNNYCCHSRLTIDIKLIFMKKILVATDFSPAAFNAAKYAAHMAMAIKADLILLHVYGIPVVYSEMPTAINAEDVRLGAEENISELEEKLRLETGGQVRIKTTIILGAFYHELKTVCEILHPYTVVLGSQGTTARERLLFGSHAVHAMRYLSWPLITVPPNAMFSDIKKIGLACDLNKVIKNTPIDEIKRLVHEFNAELHVMNTGKETVFDPDQVFEAGMLQERLIDLKPIYDFISNENTDEGILKFAEENNIDLLIVLPKRHNLLDAIIHRSHTKHFVLHSHVPVMALHHMH